MYNLGHLLYLVRIGLLPSKSLDEHMYLYLLDVASLYAGYGRAFEADIAFCGHHGYRVIGYNRVVCHPEYFDSNFEIDEMYAKNKKINENGYERFIRSTINLFRAAKLPDVCNWVCIHDPLWGLMLRYHKNPITVAPEWIIDQKFNPAIALLSVNP